MVGVTLILAAIIGPSVFGVVSDLSQDEPLAGFEMNQDGATVTLTHAGGDSLDGENVYLQTESGDLVGSYAGTDKQACKTTHATVKPGTTCQIEEAPTGDILVVWRSAGRSKILFEGRVAEQGGAATSAESIEAVKSEGVDAQSSQVELVLENAGENSVTIVEFAVEAPAISEDIWIDDGNNPEFETSGAADNGNANNAARKGESFLADGTVYQLEDNSGENAKLAASDDAVTVTVRAFGPDDEWIDDSDELELVEDPTDADIIISLGLSDGSTAELHLGVV